MKKVHHLFWFMFWVYINPLLPSPTNWLRIAKILILEIYSYRRRRVYEPVYYRNVS